MESVWATLRGTVYNTATELLGPSTRKHKDWFNENAKDIQYLLDENNHFHKAHLPDQKPVPKKDSFNTIRTTVQIKLRQMQDSWFSIQAEKIQGYADRHDLKNFYNALKEVYGPTPLGSSPLLSRDGSMLLTDKDEILETWVDHFNNVLYGPSSINDVAINRLPQFPVNLSMDVPPTLDETRKAIHQLSNGRAPGTQFMLRSTRKVAYC